MAGYKVRGILYPYMTHHPVSYRYRTSERWVSYVTPPAHLFLRTLEDVAGQMCVCSGQDHVKGWWPRPMPSLEVAINHQNTCIRAEDKELRNASPTRLGKEPRVCVCVLSSMYSLTYVSRQRVEAGARRPASSGNRTRTRRTLNRGLDF